MQILPDVYLVEGFAYARHPNSYLVQTDEGAVLVDTGLESDDALERMQAHARRWGLDLAAARHVLITHVHYDHAGHAAELQRRGARLVTNADGAEAMAAGDARCIGYAVHRRFEPCRAEEVIADGDEVRVGQYAFRCIEAPGHAGSCVIYELAHAAGRVWFCGDVICTERAGGAAILGWAGGPDYDRPVYLRTLERLVDLGCDHLLPGHGVPCLGQGGRLVENAYTKAMIEWR